MAIPTGVQPTNGWYEAYISCSSLDSDVTDIRQARAALDELFPGHDLRINPDSPGAHDGVWQIEAPGFVITELAAGDASDTGEWEAESDNYGIVIGD